MRTRRNYCAPGSAVVMAIGLLVILAMLGTAFVVITQIDRREAVSLATAAPVRNVAMDVLEQIRQKIQDDAYAGEFGRYSSATTPQQVIDYPDETVDPWLADIEPVMNAASSVTEWRHMSDLWGIGAPAVSNVSYTALTTWTPGRQDRPNTVPKTRRGLADGQPLDITSPPDGKPIVTYVDADGDGLNDSVLHPTGVQDAYGRQYWAAVRVVDTSGLVNLNVAGQPLDSMTIGRQPVATNPDDDNSGQIMTPSNISLRKTLYTLNCLRNSVNPYAPPPTPPNANAQTAANSALHAVRLGRSGQVVPTAAAQAAANNLGDRMDDEFAFYARFGLTPDNHDPDANRALYPYTLSTNLYAQPGNVMFTPFDQSDMLALADASGKSWPASRLMNALPPIWPINAAATATVLNRPAAGIGPLAPAYATAYSSSSIAVPRNMTDSSHAQMVKADLNRADFYELYNAFYNVLNPLESRPGAPPWDGTDTWHNLHARMAAQLAVNVIDFRDVDDVPTCMQVPDPPGTFVCGYERQPFVTEVGWKLIDASQAAVPDVTELHGLELFNPYASDIDMTGWKIECGDISYTIGDQVIPNASAGKTIIRAGQRWFITSKSGGAGDNWAGTFTAKAPTGTLIQESVDVFNLRGNRSKPMELIISRPSSDAAHPAIVAHIRQPDLAPNLGIGNSTQALMDPPGGPHSGEPVPNPPDRDLVRPDTQLMGTCLYGLDLFKLYEDDPNGVNPPPQYTWGMVKTTSAAEFMRPTAPLPIPLYVRNAPFETLADLDHVLCFAPIRDTPVVTGISVAEHLTHADDVAVQNGTLADTQRRDEIYLSGHELAQFRLSSTVVGAGYTYGGGSMHFDVPLLSLAGEFVMVNSPAADRCDNNNRGAIDGGYALRVDAVDAAGTTIYCAGQSFNFMAVRNKKLQFVGQMAKGKPNQLNLDMYGIIGATANTITLTPDANLNVQPGDRFVIVDYWIGDANLTYDAATNTTTLQDVSLVLPSWTLNHWSFIAPSTPPATVEVLPDWDSLAGTLRVGHRIAQVKANPTATSLTIDGKLNYANNTKTKVRYIVGRFDRPSSATHEDHVSGLININTAPMAVIDSLLQSQPNLVTAGSDQLETRALLAIKAKRDPGLATALLSPLAGGFTPNYFRTAGEVNKVICDALFNSASLPTTPLTTAETSHGMLPTTTPPTTNYVAGYYRFNCAGGRVLTTDPNVDDGLPTVNPIGGANVVVNNEPGKRTDVPYSWMANLVTTRSDTFMAYIYIEIHDAPDPVGGYPNGRPVADSARRYVSMIDRSNVRMAKDNVNQLNVPPPAPGTDPNPFELFVYADASGNVVASGMQRLDIVPAQNRWIPDSFAGERIEILSGSAKGQVRTIRGNSLDSTGTMDAVYVDSPWDGWQQWNTNAPFGAKTPVTIVGQSCNRWSIRSDYLQPGQAKGMTYHIGNRASVTMFCEMD